MKRYYLVEIYSEPGKKFTAVCEEEPRHLANLLESFLSSDIMLDIFKSEYTAEPIFTDLITGKHIYCEVTDRKGVLKYSGIPKEISGRDVLKRLQSMTLEQIESYKYTLNHLENIFIMRYREQRNRENQQRKIDKEIRAFSDQQMLRNSNKKR